MDLATTIGFFGGNLVVMYTAPMEVFLGLAKAIGTAFKKHNYKQGDLISLMGELATVGRKDRPMALEGREMPHKFIRWPRWTHPSSKPSHRS